MALVAIMESHERLMSHVCNHGTTEQKLAINTFHASILVEFDHITVHTNKRHNC